MPDITILYLTDSVFDPWLAQRCRELLLVAADGLPIVSVSQAPLDFGENICVGNIGRSGLSLETQEREGLLRVKTRWVAIAEHDCIYSSEHFRWRPSDNERFWYNTNVWIGQVNNNSPDWDGTFSYRRRYKANSQLVCSADLLLRATHDRLTVLGDYMWQKSYGGRSIGEPGNASLRKALWLCQRPEMHETKRKCLQYILKYTSAEFATQIPNIELRHGNNFTGARRGNKRRRHLEPWGDLERVLYGRS